MPKPIRDPSRVNERRKSMHLGGTEKQYIKRGQAEACPIPNGKNVNVNYIQQLLALFYKDQQFRRKHEGKFDSATVKNYYEFDGKQGRKLRSLIKQYGWPSYDNVGTVADKAVIMFVHQDEDLHFQKMALSVVHSMAEKKQIGWPGYGYLYDRVMVSQGKKQRYGTQGHCVSYGKWQPYPIEDPDQINKRRKALHLIQNNGTESEYIQSVTTICGNHNANHNNGD